MATMTTVMDSDPFEAVMRKSRAELTALLQQTEAARQTLRALESTLATTQAAVTDAQGKPASPQQATRDAEAKAAKIINDAKALAGAAAARAAKESKALLDDARARCAAAARLLATGDTAGVA